MFSGSHRDDCWKKQQCCETFEDAYSTTQLSNHADRHAPQVSKAPTDHSISARSLTLRRLTDQSTVAELPRIAVRDLAEME